MEKWVTTLNLHVSSHPFPLHSNRKYYFALNFIFDSEMPLKYLPKSPSSQIVKQNEPSENCSSFEKITRISFPSYESLTF